MNYVHRKEKNMKERTKKRLLPTFLIAITLPLIVFLTTPFDIYAGNYNEFVFSLTNYIWVCLAIFIISSLIIFFSLLFLPNKVYRPISALFLGLAFLCFLQSNLLNSSLTALQGDAEATLVSNTWIS